MSDHWMRTVYAVHNEAVRAREVFGDYTSACEALGVLTEEFDELKEAIRSNDLDAIAKEATQVAAVAARLAAECRKPSEDFRLRSTGRA